MPTGTRAAAPGGENSPDFPIRGRSPPMLITRILTAAVLAGLFVPALFLLPMAAWSTLCLLIIAGCATEWAALSGVPSRWMQACFAALIAGSAMVAFLSPKSQTGWYLAASIFWIAAVPWLLRRGQMALKPSLKLAAGALVLIPAALAMMEIRSVSPGLLLALMAIVWISDSAAFFAGRAWGRRKLAPAISPGKSWEGVFGAIAAVLVYAVICITTLGHLVIPRWLPGDMAALLVALFWIALVGAGIMGDLIESLLKRMAGVKDSGTLLPGHGGLLDRVDALLPILPICALFYLR